MGRIETLGDKLTDVKCRLERVESQRSMILVAVAAFAAGVLLVTVLVTIVWLLMLRYDS